MSIPFIDTDVIIRFLTGDDLDKQAAAAKLFEQIKAGHIEVAAPVTVIADAVYVLSSPRLYHLPREQITALLAPLARLRGFKVHHRRIVLRALTLYATTKLDFGDVMIAASMEQSKAEVVYSYDAGLGCLEWITRREP